MYPSTPRYSEIQIREALAFWYKEVNDSPDNFASFEDSDPESSGDYLIQLLNQTK